MQGEIVNKKLPKLHPPTAGKNCHVYCSPNNPGARELMDELVGKHLELNECIVTVDFEQIASCDFMLIYLTGRTWTSGRTSDAFADEVRQAMDTGVEYVLAHEMTGRGGQEARHGCEFSAFFACEDGATPGDLLRRGIYGKIAMALKGGPWREASMMMLAQALIPHSGSEADTATGMVEDLYARSLRLARAALARASTRTQLRSIQLEMMQATAGQSSTTDNNSDVGDDASMQT